jgi:hypothetical protein
MQTRAARKPVVALTPEVDLRRMTGTVGIWTRQQIQTGCCYPMKAIYFAGTQGQARRHSNSWPRRKAARSERAAAPRN